MPRTKQQKPRHITESEKRNEAPSSPTLDNTCDNIEKQRPKSTEMVEYDDINSCSSTRDQRQYDVSELTDSLRRNSAISAPRHLFSHEKSEHFTPNRNPIHLNSESLNEKEMDFSDAQPENEEVTSVQKAMAPSYSPYVPQQPAATENKLSNLGRQSEPTSSPIELTVKTQRKSIFGGNSPQRHELNLPTSNSCTNSISSGYAESTSKYMENLRILMSQAPKSTAFNKNISDYSREFGMPNPYSGFTNINPHTVNYYMSELTDRWNQIMLQQLSKVPMMNSLEGPSGSSIPPSSLSLNQHHQHLRVPHPGQAKSSPNPFANEKHADRQKYESAPNFNQFQPWPTHQIWLDYQTSLAKLNPNMHSAMSPLNLADSDIKSKQDSRRASLGSGYYSPNTRSPLPNSRRQSQVKFDSDALSRKPFDLPVSMHPSSSTLSSPASISGSTLQNLVSPAMQNMLPMSNYPSPGLLSSNDFSRDPYFSASSKILPVKKSRSRGQPIDDIHAAIVREAKEQFKGLDPENMYIQCPICQKRIKRLYHFQRHMRIHTGEKTHHCKYCQYKSVRKDNLKSHMKTHDKQNVESNRRPANSTPSNLQEREKISRNSFSNKDEGPSYSYPNTSNHPTISRETHGSPLNMVNKFQRNNFMSYPCFPTFNTITQNFYCNQEVNTNSEFRKSPREDSQIKEIQDVEPARSFEIETKRNGERVMPTISPISAEFGRSPNRQTTEGNLGHVTHHSVKRDSRVLEPTTSDTKVKDSSKKPKLSFEKHSKSFDKNDFSLKPNENSNNNKQPLNHIENNSLKQNQCDQKIDLFPQATEKSTTSFDMTDRVSPVNKRVDIDSPNSKLQHSFRYEKFQEFLSMRKTDTESSSERSVTSSNSLATDEFSKGSPRSQLSSSSSEDELANNNANVSMWQNPRNDNAKTTASQKSPYLQDHSPNNLPAKNEEIHLAVKNEPIYHLNSASNERSPRPLPEGIFSCEANLNDATAGKEFCCRICKLTFDTNAGLQGHVSINHKQDGFYKCSECIYLGKNLSKLVEHIRIHTGERPFKCNQCNYAAKRKDNLAQHKAVRHDKRKSKPVGLYGVYDQITTNDFQKNDQRKISNEFRPAFTHKKSFDYSQFSKFPFDPNFSKNYLSRSDAELTLSPTAPLTPPFQMFNPPAIQPRSPTMMYYPFFVPPIVHPMGMNSVLNGVASTNGNERISGRYSFNIRAALI